MASVDALGPLLQGLTALKPPGVSKSKIAEINNLCITHIASDSAIVETISTHYSTVPNSHKLGVLYVVDSVTRKWIEKAVQSAQPLIGSAAAPGTYAHGVYTMTQALPAMMNDLVVSSPENQKDKVSKLIDIWKQAKCFPEDMLGDFQHRLAGPSQARSFPSSATPKVPQINSTATATNGASGLAVPPVQIVNPGAPATAPLALPQVGQLPGGVGGIPPPPPTQQNSLLAAMQAAIPPAPANGNLNPLTSVAPAMTAPQFATLPPPPVIQHVPQVSAPAPPALTPQLDEQHLQLLQTLINSGVPQEQIIQIASSLGMFNLPPPQPPVSQAPLPVPVSNAVAFQSNAAQTPMAGNSSENKRSRSRSRSPDLNKRRRVTPPNRRESPVYGVYDPDAPRQAEPSRPADQGGRGNGGRNRGRGRRSSPVNNNQNNRPPSPAQMRTGGGGGGGPGQPKYIAYDKSLPKGTIRVLSRTLFVGGVAAPEPDIRGIFSRFGTVQTCIVNQDKRHAFVKMANRPDAVRAKEGMEAERNSDVLAKARSTRWGVGFGPRECSDYSKGESVVPIHKLTEADKRWLLTAEYGGTGGKAIETGMVVEEPDIEIGAGVSSKAMSRRIENGFGKQHQNQNHRGGRDHNRHQNHNQNHNHNQRGQNATQQHDAPVKPQMERYVYGYDRGPSQQPPQQQQQQPYETQREQPLQRGTGGRGSGVQRYNQQQFVKPEPNTSGLPPAVPSFGFQLPGVNLNFR